MKLKHRRLWVFLSAHRVLGIFGILFFATAASFAKYSQDTFLTPCLELEIEIDEKSADCRSHFESNEVYIDTQIKQLKANGRPPIDRAIFPKLEYSGVRFSGKIAQTKKVKCRSDHKMDEKKTPYFKPSEKPAQDFFWIGGDCSHFKKSKSIKLRRPNLYCDTPGAHTIADCFMLSFGRELHVMESL